MSHSQTIRAHFDGRTIVPDQAVNLPIGKCLRVTVAVASEDLDEGHVITERVAKLDRLFDRLAKLPSLPHDVFDRENLYDDEGRLM